MSKSMKKSKSMKNALVPLFVLLAILLSPAGVAAEAFGMSGEIYELTNKVINVGDIALRISPTVKIKTPLKNKARLQDLKVGDHVFVDVVTYNGKRYADRIVVLSAVWRTL
ncbi:MAG: hypothetical protein GY814_17100 [Gammaproteobacteria bacterium]|nr:hypothetical protein [Gammaproteobacteria bacterium]